MMIAIKKRKAKKSSRSNRSSLKSVPTFSFYPEIESRTAAEWDRWTIRTGMAAEANLPVSRIGIYTDFT